MGRKFATFYRFILMGTSVSAVVLSIISATSCAFVSFDHQYKTSATADGGRRMMTELKERVEIEWNLRRRRRLQDASAGGVGGEDDPFAGVDLGLDPEDFNLMPGIQMTEPTQTTPPTEPQDDIPFSDVMNSEMGTVDEETAQTNAANIAALGADEAAKFGYDENGFPMGNDDPDEFYDSVPPANGPNGVEGDTMAGSVAAPAETSGTAPANGPNSVGGDTMAGSVAAPAETSAAPANGPNGVGVDPMAGAVPAGQDEDTGDVNFGPGSQGDSMAGAVPAGQDVDTGDVDFGPGSQGDSMAGEYSGESSTPQVSGGGGTYGSSAYGSESTAASASGASAIVKGDAGLFCDTDPSFTYTSLWNGGSIKAFEAEIASESDNNKSEEIARNAIIVAVAVGVLMATILTIEFLLGWKMCLEKWFVGLLALIACGSQGATFAFFNSQRYCDGDILNEILNQEPCVFGQGAIMSVVAMLLYFFTLLLVCKVPEDDPYGLCCKGRKNKDADKVFQGEGDGMLMGSNPNDANPERPGWISEDNRSEEEENEII
mmetsp:Transcript_27797/g.45231  ORF Transcript_27797/g.45231 Transcript_27797/m.45231 type:complete len:545 (+) Transcript_27797:219-1853(+)